MYELKRRPRREAARVQRVPGPEQARQPRAAAARAGEGPSPVVQHFARQTQPDSTMLSTLSMADLLYLQRATGNRAVAEMIGRPRWAQNTGSDPAEQEGARSAAAMRIHPDAAPPVQSAHDQSFSEDPNHPQVEIDQPAENPGRAAIRIQRRAVGGGFQADPEVEAEIRQAQGGGQPLDSRMGSKMGRALGTNFSDVRVHTNAKADRLNRSLHAKAFTTGTDIFFRRGAYQPESSAGQTLLAHELTHVEQQRGGQPQIQRVEVSENEDDPTYTSTAKTGTKLTEGNGVVTAVSGKSPWGGHAWVYLEYLKENKPVTMMSHIFGTGEDESGKDTPNIVIDDVQNEPDTLGKLRRSRRKRSWVVTNSAAEAALGKARALQSKQESMRYTHSGGGLFGRVIFGKKANRGKRILNCARYARDVIRAAGVNVHSGRFFHTPTELVLGKKFQKNKWVEKKKKTKQKTKSSTAATPAPTTGAGDDPMDAILQEMNAGLGLAGEETPTPQEQTSEPEPTGEMENMEAFLMEMNAGLGLADDEE